MDGCTRRETETERTEREIETERRREGKKREEGALESGVQFLMKAWKEP